METYWQQSKQIKDATEIFLYSTLSLVSLICKPNDQMSITLLFNGAIRNQFWIAYPFETLVLRRLLAVHHKDHVERVGVSRDIALVWG